MRPEPGYRMIESILYRKLFPLHQTAPDRVLLRFPINCSPRGEAAHWNKQYGSGTDRLKNFTRSVGRRLAPGLWL
jgi:hypothetical protein